MRVDVWWNKVRQSDKYPVLSKMVLALCTIFHGPTVESCFNIMGDIINPHTSRMSISLYNAYQTVKYHLHAHVERFSFYCMLLQSGARKSCH